MDDMNKVSKHLLVMVAVIIAICLTGRCDYNEEILYHMSDETYEALRAKLGDVSTNDLVDVYMADKDYWDSLGALK